MQIWTVLPKLPGMIRPWWTPEDPGVAECDLPQDVFGEFYLMLALTGHVVTAAPT